MTAIAARDRAAEYARERDRRARLRGGRRCARCKWQFTPARADARYCSHRCRTIAYRTRHWTWSLITWDNSHLSAQFRYFPTRREAVDAAPPDAPWTVVDVAIPVTPHPPVLEFLRSRLIEGLDPYRTLGKAHYHGI